MTTKNDGSSDSQKTYSLKKLMLNSKFNIDQ